MSRPGLGILHVAQHEFHSNTGEIAASIAARGLAKGQQIRVILKDGTLATGTVSRPLDHHGTLVHINEGDTK